MITVRDSWKKNVPVVPKKKTKKEDRKIEDGDGGWLYNGITAMTCDSSRSSTARCVSIVGLRKSQWTSTTTGGIPSTYYPPPLPPPPSCNQQQHSLLPGVRACACERASGGCESLNPAVYARGIILAFTRATPEKLKRQPEP